MKSKYINILIIALTTFIVFACGNSQDLVERGDLKNRSDKELREILFEKSNIGYHFFYAKINVDIVDSKQSQSFKTNLKLNVDTACGGTLNAAAFVFGGYMVNQDSVMFKVKGKKCYVAEPLSYVSNLFGAELEFELIQQLILGLPFGLDEETKYVQLKADDHYVLSTHKKGKYKKLEQDKLKEEDANDIFIQYHIGGQSLALDAINVQAPADSVAIDITFLERIEEEGHSFPGKTEIKIVHPKDSVFISLEYGSIKLNEKRSISFNIPDSYERCD